jgi:hypothetical protein
MSKIKINLDRPGISSKEIANKMNFEEILLHQKIMTKPFYKSAWFYGVSGIASVSLIASTLYSMNMEGDKIVSLNTITERSNTLKLKIPDSKGVPFEKEITENKINKKTPIEEKPTLKTVKNQNTTIIEDDNILNNTSVEVNSISNIKVEAELPEVFSFMDLYPRISGRLNGSITKEELLNDKGLVTNSTVKIVSFQLHLVDATGGKVFESKGNILNSEMKMAIGSINVGEEIYFEKIDGQASTGEIVRLSPLRYVLLN